MAQDQDLNRSMPKLDFQFLAKLAENKDYEDDVPDERGWSRKEITLVAPVRPVLNSARVYDRDRDLGPMSKTQVLDNQLKKFLDETNNVKSDLADSPSSTSHQIYLKGVKSPQGTSYIPLLKYNCEDLFVEALIIPFIVLKNSHLLKKVNFLYKILTLKLQRRNFLQTV